MSCSDVHVSCQPIGMPLTMRGMNRSGPNRRSRTWYGKHLQSRVGRSSREEAVLPHYLTKKKTPLPLLEARCLMFARYGCYGLGVLGGYRELVAFLVLVDDDAAGGEE